MPFLPKPLATKVQRAAHRGLSYLSRTQRSDGAWIPLWFGNEAAPLRENPVCRTAQVLIGLNTLSAGGIAVKTLIQRAQAFLISAQLPECNRVMAFPSALQVARICPMASVRSMSSMEPEPRALPSQHRSWDPMRTSRSAIKKAPPVSETPVCFAPKLAEIGGFGCG